MINRFAALTLFVFVSACGGEPTRDKEPTAPVEEEINIEEVAERYVKLSLGIGEYDKNFVDAYHGPQEWADDVKTAKPSIDDLETEAIALIDAVSIFMVDGADLREAMLNKQLNAALTRLRMAKGNVFSFNEETVLLYDAEAPVISFETFDKVLEDIEQLVPGEGPLHERVDAFRASYAIPEDKLQAVFELAIAECRKRTLAHFDLPEGERFQLEFVKDKPWSGYNWYQGDFNSLIQVNTDFPIIIDRAIDLGCHEGYPGHHTWNVLLEQNILIGKGWIEYSIYPLFSPMSLISEGSANFGIELAFPGDEKLSFERDILFPLAGLDPARAANLDQLNKATRDLSHARNQIARQYLDGSLEREQAIILSMKYGMRSRERAEQGMDFIETYRAYVINYNLGKDLVKAHIENQVNAGIDRWDAFRALLVTPTSASDLYQAP